jgi:hypothetical protein
MKIKSRKIIDIKGEVQEHFVNIFDSEGLVKRKEYLNTAGSVTFYSIFEYDQKGNWITKKEFDTEGNIQVSYQREFDYKNREVKSIELTAENKIWEWHEKQYPDDKTVIYLSKDENGKIDHKTIENIETGVQKRFRTGDSIYATIIKEFDKENRLTLSKTIDCNGDITEENQYNYNGSTQIWKLYLNGKYIKSEESKTDRKGNVKFYTRRDQNEQILEWKRSELDKYDNTILVEGAIKSGKPTYKNIIELEYLKK